MYEKLLKNPALFIDTMAQQRNPAIQESMARAAMAAYGPENFKAMYFNHVKSAPGYRNTVGNKSAAAIPTVIAPPRPRPGFFNSNVDASSTPTQLQGLEDLAMTAASPSAERAVKAPVSNAMAQRTAMPYTYLGYEPEPEVGLAGILNPFDEQSAARSRNWGVFLRNAQQKGRELLGLPPAPRTIPLNRKTRASATPPSNVPLEMVDARIPVAAATAPPGQALASPPRKTGATPVQAAPLPIPPMQTAETIEPQAGATVSQKPETQPVLKIKESAPQNKQEKAERKQARENFKQQAKTIFGTDKGLDKVDDKWMAVMELGLRMMASNNPSLAGALGEAGLGVLDSQKADKQLEADNAARAQQIALREREVALAERTGEAQIQNAVDALGLDRDRLALQVDNANFDKWATKKNLSLREQEFASEMGLSLMKFGLDGARTDASIAMMEAQAEAMNKDNPERVLDSMRKIGSYLEDDLGIANGRALAATTLIGFNPKSSGNSIEDLAKDLTKIVANSGGLINSNQALDAYQTIHNELSGSATPESGSEPEEIRNVTPEELNNSN